MSDETERQEEAARVFADTLKAEQANEEQPPSDEGQGDPQPEPETQQEPETPDYLSDNFNPELLPDELKPAYKQMRGDYTRKTQETAQYRRFFEDRGLDPNDPEAVFAALANDLGYQLEDTDPDELDDDDFLALEDDDTDPVAQRVDALEASIQAERQQAADLASLTEDLDVIKERMGRAPTEDEISFFGAHATRDRNGRLSVLSVYEQYDNAIKARLNDEQKQWAKSKEAPRIQSGGTRGVPSVDLSDDEARLAYTAEILARELQS